MAIELARSSQVEWGEWTDVVPSAGRFSGVLRVRKNGLGFVHLQMDGTKTSGGTTLSSGIPHGLRPLSRQFFDANSDGVPILVSVLGGGVLVYDGDFQGPLEANVVWVST